MFLGYVQSIAYSRSEDEFNKRVTAVRKSHFKKKTTKFEKLSGKYLAFVRFSLGLGVSEAT